MRFTICLCAGLRDVTVRRWKLVWACRGKFYEYPFKAPTALTEKGIEVLDLSSMVSRPKTFEKWTPPDDLRFAEPVLPEQQPDWHDEPVLTHSSNVRLFEGVKQACIIAKAQDFEGFPPAVEKLIGAVETQNRDLLLQRFIMQANVWNTDDDKLPRIVNPDNPRWNYKREFGVTDLKISKILLQNFLRLCQSHVTDFPALNNRKQVPEPYIYSYVTHRGKPIIMRENLDMVLTSDTMLPPFAGEEVIDASVTYKLPDMWPVYPTVDFLETNNYELNSKTGFKAGGKFTCPHTIIQIPRKLHWEEKHHKASQIMTCFMYAAAEARKRFGENVRILPEPISLQHVSLEQGTLLFTFFQLNTLDLDSRTGVKNLVWTTEKSQLYEKLGSRPWETDPKLQAARYHSYDPSGFERFLAVYLNGVAGEGAGTVDREQERRAVSS